MQGDRRAAKCELVVACCRPPRNSLSLGGERKILNLVHQWNSTEFCFSNGYYAVGVPHRTKSEAPLAIAKMMSSSHNALTIGGFLKTFLYGSLYLFGSTI